MIDLTIPDILPIQISTFLETLFLFLLLVIVIVFTFTRDLLASLSLLIFFSLTICFMYLLMYAPDVAMTEAAVGACITTIIPFAAIHLVEPNSSSSKIIFSPLAFLVCFMIAIILLFIVNFLPPYGNVNAITNNYLVPYYLMNTGTEIGINSPVAAILASYRGYDTLGETVVILTAGLAVFMLLHRERPGPKHAYIADELLTSIAKIIIPIITIYALYIQIHGEVSPGGGFQAGAILASILILYATVTNANFLLYKFSFNWLKIASCIGVLIYALVGMVAIYHDGEFLDYSVLTNNPTAGQMIGIFVIELGVAITVFSTLASMFLLFAVKGKDNAS